MEKFWKKAPFLATVLALLAFSVSGFAFSTGVVFGQFTDGSSTDGSSTDGDVIIVTNYTPTPEPEDEDDGDATTTAAPSATPIPPAAPIDPGPSDDNDAGVDAAGLPATGSGGYLDRASGSNNTLYMVIAALTMAGLAGSMALAHVRSRK